MGVGEHERTQKLELWQLRQRQAMEYPIKNRWIENRIREYHDYFDGNIYVSLSGGLGSLVTLYKVRELYPDVPGVHVPIECPENLKLVKSIDNVEIIRPKKKHTEVLKAEGFPVVSKKVSRMLRDLQNPTEANAQSRRLYLEGIRKDGRKSEHWKLPNKWYFLIDAPFKISERCCDILKKEPLKRYERKSGRKPIVGTQASESIQRESVYLLSGCNTFKGRCMCRPMSFWLDKDIQQYIKENNIEYSKIYDMGYTSTGCMFCLFGAHLEKPPNRIQLLERTHPKLYKYYMDKINLKEVMKYVGIPYTLPNLDDFIT